jgi:hypothetical protein
MKIRSVELLELSSVANPSLGTRTLLADSHEIQLIEGWVRWRIKGGVWHRSPLSMVRNICEEPERAVEMPADNSHAVMQQAPDAADFGIKRRGRPAKQ